MADSSRMRGGAQVLTAETARAAGDFGAAVAAVAGLGDDEALMLLLLHLRAGTSPAHPRPPCLHVPPVPTPGAGPFTSTAPAPPRHVPHAWPDPGRRDRPRVRGSSRLTDPAARDRSVCPRDQTSWPRDLRRDRARARPALLFR